MTKVADKLWKTLLAIVAILEILSCLGTGERTNTDVAVQQQQQQQQLQPQQQHGTFLFWSTSTITSMSTGKNESQCTGSTTTSGNLPIVWSKPSSPPDNVCNASEDATVPPLPSSSWYSSFPVIIHNFLEQYPFGLLLACLWIIDCIRRAKQTRALALDRFALLRLEETIANLHTSTTTPTTVESQQASPPTTIRMSWMVPVLVTLVWRFSLSPSWATMWQGSCFNHLHFHRENATGSAVCTPFSNTPCFPDTSLAHTWITQVSALMDQYLQSFLEQFHTVLWQWLLPFHVWQEPILFFQRLRLLARWLRHVRFAGPLLRMLLKIVDQLWVLAKTWYQAETVESERAKRLASRSLLQRDLERIEQQHKWQTTLASMSPSLLQQACRASDASPEVTQLMEQRQQSCLAWKERLDGLKRGVQYGSGVFSSVDIYDGVVELEGDPANHYGGPTYSGLGGQSTVYWHGEEEQSLWNRYLISPQTRFSVAWRLIVTVALLSELGRLYVSWHLVGSFQLSYPDLTDRLWGRRPRTFTIQGPNGWKTILDDMLGKIFRQNHSATTSVYSAGLLSANSSLFLLQVLHTIAHWGEVAIDIVGFLDILVWFFTGELDKNGSIIPKPFFTRCILPGTLIQVLDHPTVPSFLPNLIGSAWSFASKVGYGRSLRWMLVLYGASSLWIIQPLSQFLFRPLRHEEYMKYTHSWVGIIPILSEGTFGSNTAWGTFDGQHGLDLQEDRTSYSGSPSEELALDDQLQVDDPNCF